MARQNIDEEWKTDPRRGKLVKILGDQRLADGVRVELNWLILDHKGKPVPLKKFKFVEDYEAIIECGLAEIKNDMVYIIGADRYHEFFEKQKENGSKGGRPKKPKNPPKPKETQNNPTETQTKPENPSISFSISNSSSNQENSKNEPPPPLPTKPNSVQNFEARFQTDALVKIEGLLNQAYGGEAPITRRRQCARILAYFTSPEEFEKWVNGLINRKNCPDPALDYAGFDAYFGKTLNDVLSGAA